MIRRLVFGLIMAVFLCTSVLAYVTIGRFIADGQQSLILAQQIILLASISVLSGIWLFLMMFYTLEKEIAGRQRMVTALRESETRLHMQYKSMPIPTYTWQKVADDFVLVDYNHSAENLSRGQIRTLLGVTSVVLHNDQPEITQAIQRCYDQQTTIQAETDYRFQTTGEQKRLAITYVFVAPDTVLAHAQDITDQQRAQKKLSEEQNLLRTVIDNIPDYIFAKDRAGRFILGNKAHNQASNVSGDAIIGRTAMEVFPTDLAERFMSDDEETMASGEGLINAERQTVDASGQRRWVLTTKVPLRNSEGQVVGLVGISRNVTDRKQLSERLERERLLLYTLINAIPDFVYVKDTHGRFLIGNQALATNLGASSPEEIIGKTDMDYQPSELAQEYFADEQAIIQSGQPLLNKEEVITDKNTGARLWLLSTKIPLFDRDGRVKLLVGVNRDITQQKHVEQELSQYRDELKSLIAQRTRELMTANHNLELRQEQLVRITDNMQDIICQIDLGGMIQYISPSSLTVLGCSAEALTGVSIFQNIHPEDVEQVRRDVQQGNRAVYRYLHANGQYLWLETLSNTLFAQEPKTRRKGYILTIRDISERKQTEQALQQSEQRFRQLAENIDDMFWMSTPDYSAYIYVSPAYERIWGHSCESLYQNPASLLEAVHPEDLARVVTAMHQPLPNTYDYDEEYRIVKPDGAIRWVHTRAFPVRNGGGEVYRLAGISSDITDQKLLEHELQDINRLKTDFLSTAAHELRTPLTTIHGFTKLLATRQFAEDRRQHYLQLISEQSTHLGNIINDLLDVSRLEAKRGMLLKLAPIQVADVIKQAATPFIESVSAHVITLNLPENLPLCMADPFRIGQVVTNLVSNAIKYSPQGGAIRVGAMSRGECIQVSVHDSGIGMTAEQQTHLFEKFYRADASNVTISGTGLGLTISKQIVELHGGTIWAESEREVGSAFHFTLPLIAEDPSI